MIAPQDYELLDVLGQPDTTIPIATKPPVVIEDSAANW
jgi:hypothetical protein